MAKERSSVKVQLNVEGSENKSKCREVIREQTLTVKLQKVIKWIFFFFLLDASEVLFPFTISYYSISLVVVREQGVHDINGNSLTCVF